MEHVGLTSRSAIISKTGIMATAVIHTLVIAAATGQALGAVHRWPNPRLDALEDLRWNQLVSQIPFIVIGRSHSFAQGSDGSGFAQFVNPCNQFGFFSSGPAPGGRTNAADWLRTVSNSEWSIFFSKCSS